MNNREGVRAAIMEHYTELHSVRVQFRARRVRPISISYIRFRLTMSGSVRLVDL